MKAVEVIPSAKRLMKSLRDIGYDFGQAVADIVDNSVEAGASLVLIDVEFDGDDSWVRIADNGKGMRPDELREAMRYGSEREYEESDLGKFGLGLKTASLSQCQRLSVASRWNPERADIASYTYDLKHIERTNRWEILSTDKDKALDLKVRRPLSETTGTVVLWQRLDRILGYKYPYGEAARKRLSQICREIESHLGMVFHRFIQGEARGKKLIIRLNGHDVKAWDPFCLSEPKTRAFQEISLQVEQDSTRGQFRLEPYILPHQDDFSSADAFREASGPANWNQQQGFYVYRANRMIQSGGWCGLRAPDEHMKLARIALNFGPKLDDIFKINVAKMRVQLPAQSRDDVRNALAPVMKAARTAYDRRSAIPKHAPPSPMPDPPRERGVVSPAGRKGQAASSPSTLTKEQWARRMLETATKRERPTVKAVLDRL